MLRCAWLATLAIGCSHPAPATPGGGSQAAPRADAAKALDDDLPRLAERMAKMYRDWKQAFADAATDCSVATARMNTLVDANADVMQATQRVLRAGHAKVKAFRTEREKYDAEIDANAKAIFESPTLAKCKNDPAFTRALERLGGDE